MSEPGGDPSSGISSGDALILPERHPACRRREARPGFRMERENLCFVTSEDVKGQAASGSNREGESTEAGRRGGAARRSVEGPVMGLERRGCVVRPWPLANWKQEEPVDEAKPFKQRSNIGSRVTREGHARFWERPEVKFHRATRHGRPISPARRTVALGGFCGPSSNEFTMLYVFDKSIDAKYKEPCAISQERKAEVIDDHRRSQYWEFPPVDEDWPSRS